MSLQGYSTLPGYGKETVRPITIWKGNSFTTISARDPHISGKDSGKGDSDFNDSDSDISGDVHKKESPPTNSECCTGDSDASYTKAYLANKGVTIIQIYRTIMCLNPMVDCS